jgi:hypothetical protein
MKITKSESRWGFHCLFSFRLPVEPQQTLPPPLMQKK